MPSYFTPIIIINLINIITTIIEALLGLRIILRFFGASTSAPFVDWVYQTTAPLLAPFSGMFPSPLMSGGFVIEFSALFAAIAYALLGYLVMELVRSVIYYGHLRDHDH